MKKRTLFALAIACAASAAAATEAAWQEDLYLGRGDHWRTRMPIAVTNSLDKPCEGHAVALKAGRDLPIAGVRLEELRLVDEQGDGLLFGVWNKQSRIENGPVPDGADVAIPVTLPAGGGATYWLYWGNPSAWGYADFFKDHPKSRGACDSAGSVSARAGTVEHLSVRMDGEDAAWPTPENGPAWEVRVPVRVSNFGDSPSKAALSAFCISDAIRGVRNAEYRFYDGGREVALCVLGGRALFASSVPARTVKTYWLYARPGSAPKAAPAEEVRSALGSLIPSDQVLVRRTMVSDEAAYASLMASDANLLKNPSFEEGQAGWTHSRGNREKDVSYEIAKTGGRFGGGFAKMSIPESVKGAWRGWFQTVPLKPGKTYFFGGFLSAEGVDERTNIAVHKFNHSGKVSLMTATSESVAGTTPWIPSFGQFKTGGDDASMTIHLTSRGHGVFAHDGLIVAEYRLASTGEPQIRAVAGDDAALAVQQVDPIVKVFRETPVADSKDFEACLARNETEPIQLAVRSANVGRLEVEVSPPRDAAGNGGISVETGWVEYVPVDYPTSYYSSLTPVWKLKHPTSSPGSDGWSGMWPDPIAPVSSGAIAAGATQPIWINFKTTASTRPGTYSGRIAWKADGRVAREDAYRVRVWDFTLPEVAETPAIYDIRLGSAPWRREFKGMDADTQRRTLWRFYSEKRICPDKLSNALTFKRDKDGRVTVDFTEYDRLAAEYFDEFKFPVSYTPRCFSCFGWGMPPRKFLDEQPYDGEWPFDGADRSQLRPEYRRVFQEALRLYWSHMKEKGWADRIVYYISDEPHFSVKAVREQMIALCKMIHEVDPTIRIYSSTWRHCPEWNDSIDVWGAGHYGCFPVAEMKARAAAGKHIWFTTDGQMCLDTPYCAVERLLPYYCAAHHAEAYEFWGATWLTYDPWKFGWHSYISQSDTPGKKYYIRYPNGDGYLIYPGVPGRFKGPVTSVRLEAVRDGVEDFSYLKALERLAAGADSRAARAKALLADFRALVPIPNAGGRHSTRILPDPEKVGRLRRAAGELLDGAR